MGMESRRVWVAPDEVPDKLRFSITLANGSVVRDFIIDIPADEDDTTDVWEINSVVAVGDTPEDGFASFTRKRDPRIRILHDPHLLQQTVAERPEDSDYDHASISMAQDDWLRSNAKPETD